MNPDLARLRRFNRAVTLAAGALDSSYLGRGRPLGPARLLFSIGAGGACVSDLRQSLGLDSGLMSRTLRELQAEGLIELTPLPGDARRRHARPTARGLDEIRAYEQLSEAHAGRMMQGLRAPDHTQVLAAIDRIATLLLRDQITITQVAPDDAGLHSCTQAYYAELSQRMGQPFTPAPDPDPAALQPPRGTCLIARSDGAVLGCVSLRGDKPGDFPARAEVKRLWLAPMARGLGLAPRLMREAEARARAMGLASLRLDTSRHLPEALGLYRRGGWREILRYNDNPWADYWFEKPL